MFYAPYFAMLGPIQIVILLALALLIFGPQRLPEIGRQVGAALREMNRLSSDLRRTLDLDDHLHLHDHLNFDTHPYETPTYSYDAANTQSGYPYAAQPTIVAAESTVAANVVPAGESSVPTVYGEAHPAFSVPVLPEPPGPPVRPVTGTTD